MHHKDTLGNGFFLDFGIQCVHAVAAGVPCAYIVLNCTVCVEVLAVIHRFSDVIDCRKSVKIVLHRNTVQLGSDACIRIRVCIFRIIEIRTNGITDLLNGVVIELVGFVRSSDFFPRLAVPQFGCFFVRRCQTEIFCNLFNFFLCHVGCCVELYCIVGVRKCDPDILVKNILAGLSGGVGHRIENSVIAAGERFL